MIDFPPVAPAVKERVPVVPVPPSVKVPIVGACGTVVAVIAEVAVEAGEEPEVLVAFAVKVYEVAEDSPVTVIGEVPEAVNPSGLEVTV